MQRLTNSSGRWRWHHKRKFHEHLLTHWPMEKCAILQHIQIINILNISCEITLRWIPQNFTDKSTLAKVMAWCRQACSPGSTLPYDVTRSYWVNEVYKCEEKFGLPSNAGNDFSSIGRQWVNNFLLIENKHYFSQYNRFHHRCQMVRITPYEVQIPQSWWRHRMETFSALMAVCEGNSPVTGEFPAKRPVTRIFDVFFDLRLNQQWRRRRFETSSRSLWRHCNDDTGHGGHFTNNILL